MYGFSKKFIEKYTLAERCSECKNIIKKYPDKIPIICEKNMRDNETPDIDKHKFLVSRDITIGQFMHVIRSRIQLPSSAALFLFVGDFYTILPNNTVVIDAYDRFKNSDGFLYLTYSKENVFG
jgi:GABA(A) receptor-associated protein